MVSRSLMIFIEIFKSQQFCNYEIIFFSRMCFCATKIKTIFGFPSSKSCLASFKARRNGNPFGWRFAKVGSVQWATCSCGWHLQCIYFVRLLLFRFPSSKMWNNLTNKRISCTVIVTTKHVKFTCNSIYKFKGLCKIGSWMVNASVLKKRDLIIL